MAVCCSLFDLGDVEKKELSLVVLGEDGLRKISLFSLRTGMPTGVAGAELMRVFIGPFGSHEMMSLSQRAFGPNILKLKDQGWMLSGEGRRNRNDRQCSDF